MNSRRFFRSLGVALVAFLLLAVLQRVVGESSVKPSENVLDYRVVACGERAILHRADPYRTEPLRRCEHALALEQHEPAWSATPFALPPYSAAFLAPFGALNFGVGRVLWLAFAVLALCLTAAALAEMLERSVLPVLLVLAPTVGFLNIRYGETVPFAIAAVALAALALQRRRPLLAGVATCVALIEPAIGLPAVVGIFVLVPAARRALLASVAVLAAVSVGAFGFARNVEYAMTFLPAQERSELLARDQYSLTHLVYVLGVPAHVASTLGSASYFIALAIGVFAARRMVERMNFPGLIVLLPVAVSMLGGPFVHDVEIAAALPAALVLARDSRLARAAVALLAIEWGASFRHTLVPVAGASAGAALLYLRASSTLQRAGYAVAVAVVILGSNSLMPGTSGRSPLVVGSPQPPVKATDISSVPWEWRIRLAPANAGLNLPSILRKVPTWFALALLTVIALGGKDRPEGQPVDGAAARLAEKRNRFVDVSMTRSV